MEEEPDNGGGINVGDILAALRRRVWLILTLTCLAAAAAVGLALSLPNQYEATATIQIDPRKKTIVSLDAVLPDIAGDTPTIESQVEILKSRFIALKVIDALGLRNDPEFGGQPERKASAGVTAHTHKPTPESASDMVLGPKAGSIGSDAPEKDVVATRFHERLKAQRVRNSLVVEVTFKSRDPVKAARIANTIAEVYVRDQIDMKVKATGLAAELLEPRLDGLRSKLAEAEQKVARFKAENGIFDAEGQLLSEKQLARLMEQTVVARNSTTEARARLDELSALMKNGTAANIAEVMSSETIRMLKDQHAKATKKEAELLTKYGPRHPEMAKVRAEVVDVESQIAREMRQIFATVKSQHDVAVDRERMLEVSLNQLKEQQSISKEVAVKLRDLEREAETSRRIFETFLGRYKQTVETQDLHLPDARIVERADVPFGPMAPKRKQIALIGLVLGLGLGTGLALLLELMRTGVSRAEEVQTLLGVPLLATLPMLKRQSDGLGDPLLAARLVLARPNGSFARAVFKMCDQLERQRHDASPRVIIVMSSLPNEGTTITGANLALALVARGARTLLIDADFRRSKLTHQLRLEDEPGLADAVGKGLDFESVILKDTSTGLAVIAAGNLGAFPLSPQDVLDAPGFAQRLARLKMYFDTIIIDCPPVLPVTDARILAGYADQIVLVATAGRTPKDVLRRTMKLLGANAARMSGIVLNKCEQTAQSGAGPARRQPVPSRRAA